MALKSDDDGFLVGDPITIDRGDFGRAMQIWKTLQKDVGDIRKALAGDIVKSITKQTRSLTSNRSAATPMRGPDGRFLPKQPQSPSVALPAANRRVVVPKPVRDVATPSRAANGRFQGNGSDEPKDDPHGEPRNPSAARKLAGDVGESVKSGVSEAMSGVDQVDPALAAAKEVGGMVAPLFKPVTSLFKGLFGNGEDKEHKERKGWYKRILSELKDLNEKPAGGGARLNLGGMAGLLLKIPGISILGRGAAALGPMLLKAAPLLGKLAVPLASMFSSVKSFQTSTEEYAARMGVELNGSLAQELGVRFVGVLGDLGNTLTFGLAGKFGETVAPMISDAIIGTTDFIKQKWGDAADWFTSTWTGITDKVTGWIDGLLGTATSIKDGVVGTVSSAATNTKSWMADKIDQTKGLFGGGSEGNRNALIRQMDAAGITDPKERAMFMAQMDHESGGFRSMEENLKYSADGLMKTFPRHYKSMADAQRDAGNPEAIANRVYGGRLGNTGAGDGYKFRGRGMIQLTGKANYEEAGKALGLDLANNPDLAADPDVAAKIATWYWQSKGVGQAARQGDVTSATRRINGGVNGLADRQAKYRNYLAAGPIMASAPARSSAAPAIDRLTPAPAAPVPTQIGSNDRGANAPSVTIPLVIGQNMGDRAIAHVATGGMASGMGN